MFENLDLAVGQDLCRFAPGRDNKRVKSSLIASSAQTKSSRKKSRQTKDTEHYNSEAC